MKTTPEMALESIRRHPKLVIADDYELVAYKRFNKTASFKNGDISEQSNGYSEWVQIRVLHRKRVGIASTFFCDEQSLNGLVERAFEIANNTEVNPWFRFPLWKVSERTQTENSSIDSFGEVTDKSFFESLYSQLVVPPPGLEEKYSLHQEVRSVFRKTEKNIVSDGSIIQKIQFSLVNENRDSFYRIDESRGSSYPFKSREKGLETLMRRADRLKSSRAVNNRVAGKYILGGLVMAAILKSIEPHLLGPKVVQSKSCLGSLLGKDVFSKQVVLIDDALLTSGEGTQRFDLEGSPAQETCLVESGVLKSFLHDATSAARFNRGSTGNLMLSPNGVPEVRSTNLYLAPSQLKPYELFEQMGAGIYIESFDKTTLELTRDGKLEFWGHGWRVAGGEPIEPLSHVFLSVDPIEILRQIDLVSDDVEFWERYGAPSVFLEKMPLRDV